jgi:hypothetical protein
MSDLFFVIRTLAFTIFIVFVLQIRVGHVTLEQHSVQWIQSSSIAGNLRSVAEGAVLAGEEGYDWIVTKTGWKSGEHKVHRAH